MTRNENDTVWSAAGATPASVDPITTTGRPVGAVRRGALTALLAGGLLLLGGAAVVNAADPSTSPTPSASQGTDDGLGADTDRTGRAGHDCPEGADGGTDDGSTGDGSTDDSGVDGSSL